MILVSLRFGSDNSYDMDLAHFNTYNIPCAFMSRLFLILTLCLNFIYFLVLHKLTKIKKGGKETTSLVVD